VPTTHMPSYQRISLRMTFHIHHITQVTISLFLLHVGLYDLVAIHSEIKRSSQVTGPTSCNEISLRFPAVNCLPEYCLTSFMLAAQLGNTSKCEGNVGWYIPCTAANCNFH
jgi:hypothetical protein